MYHTILIPLDGSPFSEHALPLALCAAQLSHAELHLVCVSEGTQHPSTTTHEHDYLAGFADRLATSWYGPLHTTVLTGSASEAIAAYAEAHQCDLVVLTTHGRGALSRAWLGSVADRLIRQLPMPMLLVRPHETDPADLNNPGSINHILIPLDGSAESKGILAHAIALGRLTDARYSLLQTIEIFIPTYGIGIYGPTDGDIDIWSKEAQQYLDLIAVGMRAEGLKVQTMVSIGPPAMTILNYAHDNDVDLIAIETHARSGAERLVLGSVADKIVRGAGVPILLHRPKPTPIVV